MEKGVEKTGKLIGEKIYDKFSSKKTQPPETGEKIIPKTKGEEIISILKQDDTPKVDNFQYVKDVYNDLL